MALFVQFKCLSVQIYGITKNTFVNFGVNHSKTDFFFAPGSRNRYIPPEAFQRCILIRLVVCKHTHECLRIVDYIWKKPRRHLHVISFCVKFGS